MSDTIPEPVQDDPIERFREVFEQAAATGIEDPNAMVLSSVDGEGRPSSRVVLLKAFDTSGFVFYTNLESRKGGEIAANPHVCLNFYWRELRQQVRVRGRAEPVTDEEADTYFASRSLFRSLASRTQLMARVAKFEAKFLGGKVPRPPHWSGFRIVPAAIEFWEAGTFRLHTRTVFERTLEGWSSHKLYP